jgi:TonB family protein
MRPPRAAALLLALAVPGAGLLAQEEPLTAGSDGVPLPKKTKLVKPTYPPEALAHGLRGIVILELVVSAQGKVESATIVRSVPGLDEAAIAAAQQWEYEPVKVGGKAVRVRVTVPVVFSLALPQLVRQAGVPELRQGVAPSWPADASGGGLVTAEVTLEADGRVGAARILEGGAPWSNALLAALKTWRFDPPPEDEVLSFRVEAEFVRGRGSDDVSIDLKAGGLQRSGLLGESSPPPAPTPAPAPASTTAAVPPPTAPPAPGPTPETPAGPPPPPVPAAATQAAVPPAAAASAAPPPPPVEVITAPPPQAPPENGISAIRDVALEPGVPDLTRGRRPVAPPLARMARATGTVEVAFSVSAAGTTTVQSVSGPDVLKPAAQQAVASWVFRRTRADRAYLVASFSYAEDKSSVVVRPQAPTTAGAPTPAGPPPP